MTLAQLQTEMTSYEFELHLALAMLKNDECPNCGVRPKDLMDYETTSIKCPVCKADYTKVHRLGESKGSWRDD